ncbi:helix-turn-helix domain-containing protein [Ponticoccus sp. SC2-23]|uniref:IclR family transcriptional regulator domain-containing protein n=1 Tax=Alexandriicola marinus TaxID=2081710 RepID=UPI0013E01EF4|nr:IclR family transcriptional regulator C-terminal domain-containing protein [Alexandriicola marinus]MBM1221327.1 helix-turn-helix domain-containing protein [Ponticoccus sp. SC6-9]MBM1225897.1 helix-turn-helix domain-containing protein [Ponticoccus sp. SC6-15]MBM1228049.1 helix-turn-helix domain-containing protein [Ponticoccus sp. SC6-38]MBM1234313.1 helix-turn-helix domain-containing protein [Ponticoccus sp. SC6-45]MBM1238551.1 helix-turn-helix domain-containing protein [Ponticoccus sp. SC6-
MASADGASTFAKGLRVLACFGAGSRGLTMADIARQTGFDRASARRLCLTLIEEGYLRKDGRVLELTPKILSVSAGYLMAHEIGRVVQPILNLFAERLDGEIALAVRDDDSALYVAQSATASARVSIGFTAGSRLPLWPTAIGRMLLARSPDDIVAKLLEQAPLRRFTETTETAPGALRQAIETARRDGHAFVSGEFERGAAGLAVPVGRIGGASAALGTTASVNRLAPREARDRALDILRQAAIALGREPGLG